MPRSIVRFALAVFVLCALRAHAQVSSTNCAETEIDLNRSFSVATLDRCGDDVHAPLLWHLDRIDQVSGTLDGHFDRQNGGLGSVIYVMDTGVMASHSEFADATGSSRVIAGFDATGSVDLGRSKCTSPNKALAPCYDGVEELPASSHGTSVASIAAGKNVGVAPDATIVSVRVMNERGLATTRTYLEGLDAIIKHAWDPASQSKRTSIVNISGWVLEKLNGTNPRNVVSFATVEQKIKDMIAGVDTNGRRDPNGKRFLFVVAANNTDGGCGPSGTIDRFPATLGATTEGLITVGGMTADNRAWNGTCRGGVEVLAPAQGIFSATITAANHYRGLRPNLRSGTSFAAPIISGIAARMLAERPDLSPQQLEWWISATPSRVDDPSPMMADGRVGFLPTPARTTAAPVTTARMTLEP